MSCTEAPSIHREIDEWLENAGEHPLADLTDYMSGNKHPQTIILGGGYNYFPESEFAEFVMKINFNYPESVVLFINPEYGPTKVFRPLFE